MAEEERSSSSSDESLNFASEKFDPVKALGSAKAKDKLPVPNAAPLDNLSKYKRQFIDGTAAGPGRGRGRAQNVDPSKRPSGLLDVGQAVASIAGTSGEASTQRRFQPHQQMVKGRPKKEIRNVLTRMSKAEPPFQRLWQAVSAEPPGKVRVLTRDAMGIHGRLEGYVAAFDKHFNLAMSDVTEVFYRSRPSRAKEYFLDDPRSAVDVTDPDHPVHPEAGAGAGAGDVADPHQPGRMSELALELEELSLGNRRIARKDVKPGQKSTTAIPAPGELETSRGLHEEGSRGRGGGGRGRGGGGKASKQLLSDWPPLPPVYWRRFGRKREECERHISQLLVRGEHVVLIQFLTPVKEDDPDPASVPVPGGEVL